MHQDIEPLYYNEIGISFFWKKVKTGDTAKVQLVFRDTGLLLSAQELNVFSENVKALMRSKPLCADCQNKEGCRSLLLETHLTALSFAISPSELGQLRDLLEGTLFQLQLNACLDDLL